MTEPANEPPTVSAWHLYVPKLYTALREGYRWRDLRADAVAGLTVAIVALPLAMALAIASGTTPDKGLVTAIVAGFLISAFGGSRVQIGGPTGAFVVVVFNVIAEHGYDGLVVATSMAGVMLVVAGLARFGTWIKYIPEPVVTGFTAGIAVIIFSSQIKDLLGLSMDSVPVDFLAKWQAFWQVRSSLDFTTLGLGLTTLALIVVLRLWRPKLPGFLIAVTAAAAAATVLALPVDTIGSRFGGIPDTLPSPALPSVTLAEMGALVPAAFTIAFLAGVESLLSAVVADGMTGRRHRSNCELVAQGVANCASAAVGGLPATGALARTATNVRSGARTPVAGMLHAVFLLLFMLVAAPLAAFVPLAALAAVLVVVAWNMSEAHRVRELLSAPWGDRLVLLATFVLTVAVDLTVAIQVGVVLAAILFMHRMSEVVAIGPAGAAIIQDDEADRAAAGDQRLVLPRGVEVFQLRGPLFFGAASRFSDVIDRIDRTPRVFILRMREVPLVDATGAGRLKAFVAQCRREGAAVIVSGLQPQPREVLGRMGVLDGEVSLAADYAEAVARAEAIVSGPGRG
jgi:SulP family sulfate permease